MTNYNNIMVIKYDRLPVFTQGYHTPLECLSPFQAIQRVPLNCRYQNPYFKRSNGDLVPHSRGCEKINNSFYFKIIGLVLWPALLALI